MAAIQLPFIQDQAPFPDVETALLEPDGLLAFGADLSVPRLVQAYRNGIFPWFSEGEPYLWWSPSERAVIHPAEFHVSKSLRKLLRKGHFTVTVNRAFDDVITACASIPRYLDDGNLSGTWITMDMIHAYQQLHRAGYAHSIEVWQNGQLAGGLYGVVTDNVFCGESMFSAATNGSKIAMTALSKLLSPFPSAFIDCQMPTDHLMSLGAQAFPRPAFLAMLKQANQTQLPKLVWSPRDVTECLV